MKAIQAENRKINRSFAGAAAAMGCGLEIRDAHGFAPRLYPERFRQTMKEAALMLVPESQVDFNDNWGTGCSDIGDVSQVMPAIHPTAGGAKGTSHGSEYYIEDPYMACVLSAKFQLAAIVRLLEKDAAEAREVVAGFTPPYPSIAAFLDAVDQLNYEGSVISYREDGSIYIQY